MKTAVIIFCTSVLTSMLTTGLIGALLKTYFKEEKVRGVGEIFMELSAIFPLALHQALKLILEEEENDDERS